MRTVWLGRLLGMLLPALVCAQDLKDFEKRVTEFTLSNGLHFIVLQRPQAPVVSVVTHVKVGGANDPGGKTGLAHMLEHMAFKGTATLGTKNWPEEKKTLALIEQIYDKLESERAKGAQGSKEAVAKLEAELKAAIEKANSFVEKEAYSKVISENGGVGMNASTSTDTTRYFYSLPANRLELWFFLNSQVFRQPIMREFYKERDVVREERRMRVESSPQGKMIELLMNTAFMVHPQRTTIGWSTDIENLRAKDSEALFRKYYVPSNMVMVVAGDVDPKEVKRLADQYLSSLPAGQMPSDVVTDEPKQEGERRVALETETQPLVYIGYKRPDGRHPDDAALAVLSGVLSSGRTGILYKEMVEQKKLALGVGANANIMSEQYPGLFLFVAAPNSGKTLEENEKEIYEIIERVKKEKVDQAALDRVKTKIRAGLVRGLESNLGMAMQMAQAWALHGDWRPLFTDLEKVDKVTVEDLQRVAKTYLVESGRTVVFTKKPSKEAN